MKCNLCEKQIEKYDKLIHHLVIDESHEFDICEDCVKKLRNWQLKVISVLFPTKSLKKKFGDKL